MKQTRTIRAFQTFGEPPAITLGAGIPLGVYHLTRVAGCIWLVTSNRIAPA